MSEKKAAREDQISRVLPPPVCERVSSMIQAYMTDEKRHEPETAERRRVELKNLLAATKVQGIIGDIEARNPQACADAIGLALMVTAAARKLAGSPDYQVESRFHQLTKKKPALKRYFSALLIGVLSYPLGNLYTGGKSQEMARVPLDKFPHALRAEFQADFKKAKGRFDKTLAYAIDKIGAVVKNVDTPQNVDVKLAAPIEESLRSGVPESMPEVNIQDEIIDCIQLRRLTFEDETLKNIFKALCEQSIEEGEKPTGLEAYIFDLFVESYWDSDRIGALYLEPSMLFTRALAQPGNQKLNNRFKNLTDEQKVIYDILVKNYNQVVAQSAQRMTSAFELAEIVRRKYKFQMIKQYCERRARTLSTKQERDILLRYVRNKERGAEAEMAYSLLRDKLDDTVAALICFYTILPGLELPDGISTKFLAYKDQQSREMGELWKIIHTGLIIREVHSYSPQKVELLCQRAGQKFPGYSALAQVKLEEHFDQYHDPNITRAGLSLY